MQPDFYRYWGKTDRGAPDPTQPGGHHLLVYHSLDVAACGRALLKQWDLLRKRIAQVSGLTENQVVEWGTFLLALHDFGKFDPAFQHLVPVVTSHLGGPPNTGRKYGGENHHSSIGYRLWEGIADKVMRNWPVTVEGRPEFAALTQRLAFDAWMRASAGHHGYPPRCDSNTALEVFCGPADQGRVLLDRPVPRDVLAWADEALTLLAPGALHLPKGSEGQFKKSSLLFAGVAIIADWMGSELAEAKGLYCGVCPQQKGETLSDYWDRAKQAADQFISEERVCPPAFSGIDPKDLFKFDRFSPMQKLTFDIPFDQGPQLFVLEDQTGSGKSEGSQILSCRMMATGHADGIYFGLPTQATSNQMHRRLVDETKVSHRIFQKEPWISLQHSNASRLNVKHTGIKGHRKTRMLAGFSVGTIDQAIVGCLTIKHSTIRLTGLASKVVVIDELHCYDEYTFHLIATLVRIQAMLGGSTIILSATLPQWMRNDICLAFMEGAKLTKSKVQLDAYPLLTHVSAAGLKELPVAPSSHRDVPIRLVHDDDDIWRTLRQAHKNGSNACWIRNTVKTAQEAYEQACREFGADAVLLHARFIQCDRRKIEDDIQKWFGKDSQAADRKGRILIATQVVEQSLDLDFNVLCTDICPADLLLQRIGRFMRHLRDRFGNTKTRLGKPVTVEGRTNGIVLVRSPKFDPNPKHEWLSSDMAPTGNVYRDWHAQIWATCRELQNRTTIRLPDDCRPLLNAVFGFQARLDPMAFPKGLDKRRQGSNFVRDHKEAQAQINRINPEEGYRSSTRWQDDDDLTRFNTRDITTTSRLRLARLDDAGTLAIPFLIGKEWEDVEVPCYEQQAASWKESIKAERDHAKVADKMARFLPRKEVLAIMAAHDREHKEKKNKRPVALTAVMYPSSTRKGEWAGKVYYLSEGTITPFSGWLYYSHTKGLIVPDEMDRSSRHG